jgi:signal transduction histidine kinase
MHGGRGQAFALICSPDGIIREVLIDELGVASRLAPGRPVTGLIKPASVKAAQEFLSKVRNSDLLLTEEFQVIPQVGQPSLFFSAQAIARGTVLFASTKRLTRTAVLSRLHTLLRYSRRPKGSARRKAGLLALTAHDLRNPIAGILAASQYLLNEPPAPLHEDHIRLLESIQASSHLLLRLVDKVLRSPGLEAGQLPQDAQPTDILALMRQNLTINQVLATNMGIRLTIVADDPPPTIAADPSRLSEVIDNLIANAIKFSPRGGTVEIRLGRRDHMALISVRDQGSGIAAADFRKVFEPFQKGRNHTRRGPGAGLGLGLAIVKRIVESYGGTVEIESQVGLGSTFTVLLPISGEEASAGRLTAGWPL